MNAQHQPEGYDQEMEQGACAVCNGSGECQHEGTRCYSCKGSGTDWYPVAGSSQSDEDFEGAAGMNTRKFPRTSVEAFGCRGDAACAVERPSRGHRVANWTMGFAIVYLIGLAVWEWLA